MGSGEQALIGRILAAFDPPGATVRVGIGDDGAVIEGSDPLVVTTDLLIENVDFRRSTPLQYVAVKSLAANLSDLAAMGSTPESFLLALGIPAEILGRLDPFITAMAAAAKRWGVFLIGGDLSSAAAMTISITAFGRLAGKGGPLLRSGAREGDALYVSRPLGAAAAGLSLLERGWTIDAAGTATPPADLPGETGYSQREFAASAIRRQVAPEPEIELGVRLRSAEAASSCIDISDGLSTDLHRICASSNVGAVVEWERVPRFPDLAQIGFSLGIDEEKCVLHGGEELALMFTSRSRESELSRIVGRPVYRIGRITAEPDVLLETTSGSSRFEAAGFDHFA